MLPGNRIYFFYTPLVLVMDYKDWLWLRDVVDIKRNFNIIKGKCLLTGNLIDGKEAGMKRTFSFEALSKYRNVLMGLEIILLVVFHFTEDCKVYDVRYDGIIYGFYKYIHSSGVDLFLLLSGLGLYFSWKKKPPVRAFYRKRFERIVIPYVIVAVPAWLWLDVIYGKESVLSFIKDFTFISFFFEETRWFWYILMAAVCYIIFPYVFRIIDEAVNKSDEWLRVGGLCIFSTVVLMMLQLYHNDLYVSTSIAVSRFPAFFIGVWLGKAAWEKRTMPLRNVFILVVLSVVAVGPLDFIDQKIWGVYGAAFLNIAFCFLLVWFLDLLSHKKLPSLTKGLYGGFLWVMGWFGKYTLEIYLIHVAVRKVMNTLGFYTYRFSYELIMVSISVLLALALNVLSSGVIRLLHREK